jgi:hypothetical protein
MRCYIYYDKVVEHWFLPQLYKDGFRDPIYYTAYMSYYFITSK